jgi:hypothetical protein
VLVEVVQRGQVRVYGADRPLGDGLEIGAVVTAGEVASVRVVQRVRPGDDAGIEPGEVTPDPRGVGAAGVGVQRGVLERRGVPVEYGLRRGG